MSQAMRLLALSDIHANVAAVERLREREANSFDGIVVAGDIGQRWARTIFKVLSSFGCPVFYVYGNHDHDLDYRQCFGDKCQHLHMQSISHGLFTLCGFSGCPTQWGKNPIAQKIDGETRQKHSVILHEVDCAEKALAIATLEDEEESAACQRALNQALTQLRTKAKSKGIDLRSSRYRKQVQRCRERIEKQYSQKRNALFQWRKTVSALKESRAYQDYISHWRCDADHILRQNRLALSKLMAESERKNSVVVTHERLTHTKVDFPQQHLYIFGHRHGFSDTIHQGSRFVNVSALDIPTLFRPSAKERYLWEDCKAVNSGTYAIIEASSNADIKAECRRLELAGEGWLPVPADRCVFGSGGQIVRLSIY